MNILTISKVTGNPTALICNPNKDVLDYIVVTAKQTTTKGGIQYNKLFVYISAVDEVYSTEVGADLLDDFEHLTMKLLEGGKLIPTNIIKKYDQDKTDHISEELQAAEAMLKSVIAFQQA